MIRWRTCKAALLNLNPTGPHLREAAICVFDLRPENGRDLAPNFLPRCHGVARHLLRRCPR